MTATNAELSESLERAALLLRRVHEVFGISTLETGAQVRDFDVDTLSALRSQFPVIDVPYGGFTNEWYECVVRTLPVNADTKWARLIAQHWFVNQRESIWMAQLPEEVERVARWRARHAEHAQKAFRNHPMCRPGVQIEVQNEQGTRLLLIGDVSPYGSEDAGEDALSEGDLVVRYRDLSPLFQEVSP